MANLRVQTFVPRSGKFYLSHKSYDNIGSALRELKQRAFGRQLEVHNGERGVLTTNYDDKVTVTHGKAVREYTLVLRRGDVPVPFGHLVKRNRG
jgi:hypothetical protein